MAAQIQSFCEGLLVALESQLQSIPHEPDTLSHASASFQVASACIHELSAFASVYVFADKAHEVLFFRQLQPPISSRAILYANCRDIELGRPFGPRKEVRRYYKRQLRAINRLLSRHSAFYAYCKSGGHGLDEVYFTKAAGAAYYSQRLAELLAAADTVIFLRGRILALGPGAKGGVVANNKPRAVWSGPKVALVELMYALHAAGVINNGSMGLSEMARLFETTFGIGLGQFNRAYLEIRARKTIHRTSFLTRLSGALLQRMDDADAK